MARSPQCSLTRSSSPPNPAIPPRVDYELTALGRSLLVPVQHLAEWALANRATVESTRQQFDARVASENEWPVTISER